MDEIERIRQAAYASFIDADKLGYDETGYRTAMDDGLDVCFIDDLKALLAALDEARERIMRTAVVLEKQMGDASFLSIQGADPKWGTFLSTLETIQDALGVSYGEDGKLHILWGEGEPDKGCVLEGENPGLRCVYKGKNTKALIDFFKATED